METDSEKRARLRASAVRVSLVCVALALFVPLALFGLFRRQELRLRALVDHGTSTTAWVTGISRNGGVNTHYRYEVAGVTHTWNVNFRDAPYEAGTAFPITYLPEDPSLSRPGAAYTQERLLAELNLPAQRWGLGGVFAFFALFAVFAWRSGARLSEGAPLRTEPRVSPALSPTISPTKAGRLVAALLLGLILAVDFDPNVQKVFVAGFGEPLFGMPTILAVALAQVLLIGAPLFAIMPHLMTIVMDAQARGLALSKFGVILAVIRCRPEHRRSRAWVLGGLVYFCALFGAWIAFTSYRGI